MRLQYYSYIFSYTFIIRYSKGGVARRLRVFRLFLQKLLLIPRETPRKRIQSAEPCRTGERSNYAFYPCPRGFGSVSLFADMHSFWIFMQHFCYKTPLPRDKDSALFCYRSVVIYTPLPCATQNPHRAGRARGAGYTQQAVAADTKPELYPCRRPRGLSGRARAPSRAAPAKASAMAYREATSSSEGRISEGRISSGLHDRVVASLLRVAA